MGRFDVQCIIIMRHRTKFHFYQRRSATFRLDLERQKLKLRSGSMAGEEGGGGNSLRLGQTGRSWRLNRSTGQEVDQEQQDDGAQSRR